MDTDSTEHVNIRTLGSADTTTIGNLAGTDVKSVACRPAVRSTEPATAQPTPLSSAERTATTD